MGLQLYVQKLSDPLAEWSFDVEASDTLNNVLTLLYNAEYNSTGVPIALRYVTLYFNGVTLDPEQTVSSYNIQKNSHLTNTYVTPASATVCGLVDYNGESPNGLYNYTFIDPGNNPYWLRTTTNNIFFLGYNNIDEYTGQWVVSDWNNYINFIATTQTITTSSITTPYDPVANLIWSPAATVSEGDVECPSTYNPIHYKYITVTPTKSAHIQLPGYMMDRTTSVYLSSSTVYIPGSAELVDKYTTSHKVSAICPAFTGYKWNAFQLSDKNHIQIDLADLNGSGNVDIIVTNRAGYTKLSDKNYLVYVNSTGINYVGTEDGNDIITENDIFLLFN